MLFDEENKLSEENVYKEDKMMLINMMKRDFLGDKCYARRFPNIT